MIAELLHRLRAARDGRARVAPPDSRALEPDSQPVDLLVDGARIGDWLPYCAYRPQDKVFVNRDSLGFVLEVTPQSGANEDTATRLKGLYSRLPTDATLQIQLWASPDVSATLHAYALLRRPDVDIAERSARAGRPVRSANVHRAMARRRYAYLRHATQSPVAEDAPVLVRNFRAFVSVTVPGRVTELSRLDELLAIRAGMLSTLRAAMFPAEVIGADTLIMLVGEWLNPARLNGRPSRPIEYDPDKLLCDQIVDRETSGDWSDPTRVVLERIGGGVEDRRELRLLSVQRTPKTYALWGMSALAGDLFQDSLQLPCPFLVTLGVSLPDQQKMDSAAVIEKAGADRDAGRDFAKFSPGAAERNQLWDAALAARAAGGKYVWSYHQIVLFARPAEADRAESALLDLWRSRGFDLSKDAYIQRAALLQSLPMGLSREFVVDLLRLKRLELRSSGNTIHLAPLIADGRGTGTPTLIGLGRRGQITTLDFFDNEQGGKNVAIVGATGSGKSTLLQEIAAAYHAQGALVRVFEVGHSFERLTRRVGGQYSVFTRAAGLNVNPLAMVGEAVEIGGELLGGIDDDIPLLQPLLAKMASPNAALDPAIYASLATVIKEEYLAHGRDTTITHIRDRYARGRLYDDRPEDPRCLDMAVMLSPFAAGGPYASYFEGRSTLDFGNDFLVFELQELEGDQHLRGVVQMILLYRVSVEMLQERHRRKAFILDEAKEALAANRADDVVLAMFLERLYLRIRKANGAAITATQDVAHYFSSPYGASIWNQSAFILLGAQSDNSIEAIARGEAIRLDEPLRRLLASIRTHSGEFREWYVHSDLFRGVLRLALNPSTRLLYSNRAEDNAPLDAEIAAGTPVTEAVDLLLARRGIEEPR